VPADRKQVLADYQVVLKLKATPQAGEVIFRKQCATCHRIGTIGQNVAPDIADSRSKQPAQLLTHILQPNRVIDSNYVSYSVITNAGQVCTSIERVYVFEYIADQFTEALVHEAKQIKLGDPMSDDTDVGPMSSKMQFTNTINKVDLAKKEGAQVLTGGQRSDKFEKGYFYEPTVFDQVTPGMDIVTEESFSPVIPIQRIQSLDEAIQMANSTKYGLGCTIFTRDIERALTAADNIKAGTFCINNPLMENIAAPFGGMKQSGIGREHGVEALEEFREAKHIFIDYDHKNKDWWFGKNKG
jgi:acyl-CoA reductase-like NAD-dependent aldehyde dehydrogenase